MASFTDTIDVSAKELIPGGSRVIVAVSGGVDSMVLMHVLHRLATKHHWRLVVAHFNHKLRGHASGADQRLVQKTAQRLKLKSAIASWTEDGATVKKYGLEMAARNARLSFLDNVARRHKCSYIATGHHRDDQVETFFWRLFRGAGGVGLGGMQQVDSFPLNMKLKIVRPFLVLGKDEIIKFANREKVKFREDGSNQDIAILRNRVRGKLIPYLRRNFHSQIEYPVSQSQELIGADSGFAKETAREWLSSKQDMPYDRLHLAVQRWAIWHQLIEFGIDPQFHQIEDLRLSVGKRFSLNPQTTILRDKNGKLHIHKLSSLSYLNGSTRILPKERWSITNFGDLRIRCRINHSATRLKPDSLSFQEQFDADRVGEEIMLRYWRRGDRFCPIGMSQSTKLQNLFTNAKVDAVEKRKRLLACTANGEIFWVQGLRIGEIAKIHSDTRAILQWEWSEL